MMTGLAAKCESPRRRDLGFTLIEVLVALSLLAILAIGVLGALRFSGRLWVASEVHASALRDRVIVERTLRDLFSSINPGPVRSTDARPRIRFDGQEASIEGSGRIPAATVTGGYQRVRLEERLVDGDRALVLAWVPERSQSIGTLADDPASETVTVLLPRIEELSVAYFGRKPGEGSSGWYPSWRDAEVLPGLIRIRIRQQGLADWPDLVVQPLVNADPLCVLDRLTQSCRTRTP